MNIPEIYNLFLSSTGISTDSRNIKNGNLFFALKGDNFNGNLFAANALQHGASYSVVDEDISKNNERIIKVSNVLECLQQLAQFHRQQLNIPVIGLTGTNGKTTTKELIANILKTQFRVSFTQGNLNNHIGVPLTLLDIDKNIEIAVVEMGANHCGEIEQLSSIAQPTCGLITNIGKAHLEGFGSFEGVIKTKSELYEALSRNNGVVFYRSDNDILKNQIQKYNFLKIITYGNSRTCEVIGKFIDASLYLKFEYKLNNNNSPQIIETQLAGSHNFENALAAVAVGNYFGITPENIKLALENYQPANKRSQLQKTASNTLLIDCYNANPSSMTAAVSNFLPSIPQNDKVLILGDMLELGEFSESEHLKILELVKEIQFNNAIFVGKQFNQFKNNFNYLFFEKIDELCQFLKHNPFDTKQILLKASRGIKMEQIIEFL